MAHATFKTLPDDARRSRLPGRRVAEAALVAVIAIGIVAFGAMFRDPDRFPIREIRIEGDMAHLTDDRFRERLGRASRAGLFGIDVNAVRREILAEPWVADVSIRRVWPDALVVRVEEEVPVARWNDGAAVNRFGEIFDPPDDDLAIDLVRLGGPDDAVIDVLTAYSEIAGLAAPHGLTPAEVRLTEQRSWVVVFDDGRRLDVGKERRRERLNRFFVGYEAYLKGRWQDVRRVDMRYPNGFAVEFDAEVGHTGD